MIRTKSMLLAAAFVVGTPLIHNAQAQYAGFSPYPYAEYERSYFPWLPYAYYQPPPTPPAWSYNPYTSGFGPCPQRFPGDPPCSETMPPSFGQPNYWPVR